MKKILQFLNHERYQAVAALICLIIIAFVVSCRSRTTSILDPTKTISRAQLVAELEFINATVQAKLDAIDENDRILGMILQQSLIAAKSGGLNLNGLIPVLFSIFGIGAVVDNVRKRRDIKRLTRVGENDTTS